MFYSLLVALAMHAVQVGRNKTCGLYLGIASAMGVAFLVLKGFEYHAHIVEGAVPGALWKLVVPDAQSVQMFFYIYFVMTGLHALHVTIGIVLLAVIALARPQLGKAATRVYTQGIDIMLAVDISGSIFANSGARVETDPSIRPAGPGCAAAGPAARPTRRRPPPRSDRAPSARSPRRTRSKIHRQFPAGASFGAPRLRSAPAGRPEPDVPAVVGPGRPRRPRAR